MTRPQFSILAPAAAAALSIECLLLMSGVVHGQSWLEPKELTPSEKTAMAKQPLGSQENPVRCSGPAGEHEYLGRLICENGKTPKFKRAGSFGLGPYGTTLDRYDVRCGKRGKPVSVFMDMYHRTHVEDRPIPGFQILLPEKSD